MLKWGEEKVEQFGHLSTYVIQVKITNPTYIRLHLEEYMCYWFTLLNKWEEGSVSNSTLCPSIILILVASQLFHYKKWNAWMNEMMSFFDPWWVVNYLVKQESSGPPMVLYHSKDKPLAWLPIFFKCRHEVSISKFEKEELFHYGENKAYTYLQDCKEGFSIALKRVFFVVNSTYFLKLSIIIYWLSLHYIL